MIPIRIWLRKEGPAIYISHLDMNRLLLRAIRRAKLPVWFTEGFNPHPYITFLAPLSLGIEGLCEPVDMRLNEELFLPDVRERLNAVLPAGVSVMDVTLPVKKAKDIAFASYKVELLANGKTSGQTKDLLEQCLAADALPILKKSKKGEQAVDLKPDIVSANITIDAGCSRLLLILPTGSVKNVNPALLLDAMADYTKQTFAVHLLSRTELFDADMNPFA